MNDGANKVGRRVKGDGAQPDVPLSGLTIQDLHATIQVNKDGITMSPGAANCEVYVNGKKCVDDMPVNHMDRILIGTSILLYSLPAKSLYVPISSNVAAKPPRVMRLLWLQVPTICSY